MQVAPVAGVPDERPRAATPTTRASIPDVEHVVPSQRTSDDHPAATISLPPPSPPPPRLSSPVPASPRQSAAPRTTSPLPATGAGTAEARLELEALMARLSGTHYEVLGVPSDASAAVIQNAFFGLAKKWHPDRLRAELADLKDQATRAFARVSEASQALSDPETRRRYDQALAGGGDDNAAEAEQVHKVLKATTAFQKAEVLLKRGALALAEKEAQIAFENDPSQADHVAIHVWIQAQKPAADVTSLLVQLEKAAKSEPNNLRVRWYRGQLLKRLGRQREAMHDFKFIVERDPRHTDAHREVRLYAMRRGNRPPSDPPSTSGSSQPPSPDSQGGRRSNPPKPGLFNKLFKKP
jgi:curved DNA-binding protein CbpA